MISDNMKKMEVLVELVGSYNKEYADGVLRRMLKALDKMTLPELEYAVDKYMEESKYPPTIAHLWEIVNERRAEEKDKLAQRVMSWLSKNTTWSFDQQANQEDVDRALVAMDFGPGSIKAKDV